MGDEEGGEEADGEQAEWPTEQGDQDRPSPP